MRNIVLGAIFLSLYLLSGGSIAGGEKADETKAKLKLVQKQLEELRKKEQALLKQLAEEDSYIKVEIKGVLRHEDIDYWTIEPGGSKQKGWTITIVQKTKHRRHETKWLVSFDDKLLAMAKTNEG